MRLNACPKNFGKPERCAALEPMVTDESDSIEKLDQKVNERQVVTKQGGRT
jgi:hypothetical protein